MFGATMSKGQCKVNPHFTQHPYTKLMLTTTKFFLLPCTGTCFFLKGFPPSPFKTVSILKAWLNNPPGVRKAFSVQAALYQKTYTL